MPEDLGKLIERLLVHGERIAIIGHGEPVVLVPLSEYEQLSSGQRGAVKAASVSAPVNPHVRRSPGRPPSQRPALATPEPLEPLDPPQGQLSDDDQYFPEPLE